MSINSRWAGSTGPARCQDSCMNCRVLSGAGRTTIPLLSSSRVVGAVRLIQDTVSKKAAWWVVGREWHWKAQGSGQRASSSGYCAQEARDESRRLWTRKDLEEHQSAVLLPVCPTEHVRTDSLFELQLCFLSGRRQVKPIDFISGNKLLEAERVDKN